MTSDPLRPLHPPFNALRIDRSTLFERLVIPKLSPAQSAKLHAYWLAHPPAGPGSPDQFDLWQYQTPNKDQNPRGSCATFAFIAGIEAFYLRKYGLALDLSEEYFIHIVHSTQSTHKPGLHHENVPSDCSGYDGAEGFKGGDDLMVIDQIAIPEGRFAPYFGWGHEDLFADTTEHSRADLPNVEVQAGLAMYYRDGTLDVMGGWEAPFITQQAVDDYEYDFRHIPLDARKNCRYGATELMHIDYGEFHQDNDPDGAKIFGKLEGLLLDNHEVVMPLGNHVMLLGAYDRTKKLFQFKNSWGSNDPRPWRSYSDVRAQAGGGVVVMGVRDPGLPPDTDAMWLGKWAGRYPPFSGRLVLRRTKDWRKGVGRIARLGSYYDGAGTPHVVTGYVEPGTTQAHLYIDTSTPEGPPEPISTPPDLPVPPVGTHLAVELSAAENFDVIQGGTVRFERQRAGLGWQVHPNGGTTDVAVAALEHLSHLCLIAKGIGDRRLYIDQFTGASWSGWREVSGGGTTKLAPAAASFGGKLYLFAVGEGDHCIYVNVSADGSNWSGASPLPGSGTTDVRVSAAVFKGRLYLLAKSIGDNGIWINSTANGGAWSGWTPVASHGPTELAPTLVSFEGKLRLFHVSEAGRIYASSSVDGASWSQPASLEGTGVTDRPVAAAQNIYGRLVLLAKGIGDKAIYSYWTGDFAQWGHATATFFDRPTNVPAAATLCVKDFWTFAVSTDCRICYTREEFVG